MDALLRRYPAKPINPDRSVFDLPLELRDGKATALRISLPPHFPQERPALSVLLPVVHPAVDSTGRLHTPGLGSWVYGSSSLVDAVAEAVASLTSAVVDARQPGGAAGARPRACVRTLQRLLTRAPLRGVALAYARWRAPASPRGRRPLPPHRHGALPLGLPGARRAHAHASSSGGSGGGSGGRPRQPPRAHGGGRGGGGRAAARREPPHARAAVGAAV